MKSMGAYILAGLCMANLVPAAPAPSELTTQDKQKIADNVRGSFDMSKNPRPYIVYMVLDQPGRYPSFWCGRNVSGQVDFNGVLDTLDDKLTVQHKGAFTVQLTNAARKLGMYDALPGGTWIEKLRDLNFRLIFESFRQPVVKELRRDGKAGETMIVIETVCTGTAGVGDKTAPFSGTATLTFSDKTPAFSLCAKFAFPGTALGLPGASGEGITGTVYTASSPNTNKPDLKSGSPGAANSPGASITDDLLK